MKIIYVDDDEDLIDVFTENFEFTGVELFTFASPIDVLEQFERIQPDLIDTDHRMPKMTGVEMVEKLPSSLPKILLTADFTVKLESQFLKIYQKPANYQEIRSFILQYLKGETGC